MTMNKQTNLKRKGAKPKKPVEKQAAPRPQTAPAKKSAVAKTSTSRAGNSARGAKPAAVREPQAQPARAKPVAARSPRIVVLRAPGTNCDRETAFAFASAGASVEVLHVNRLLENPALLDGARGLALPGGFSFGDDLGAGAVLGTILRTRLADPMRRLVERGGIVLGICNGFQVLVRTGLLPGFADDAGEVRLVALASNVQNRYQDRWVEIEAVSRHSVFFRPGQRVRCPVAHAEGRFLPRDEGVLAAIQARDLVALRYVPMRDGAGCALPHNPNGATDDIAGIVDATGRVLGLMPHPERNQFPWQDERFHRGEAPRKPEGRILFDNAVAWLRGNG